MVIGDTRKSTKSSFIIKLLGGSCVAHIEGNEEEVLLEEGDGDTRNATNSSFIIKLLGGI